MAFELSFSSEFFWGNDDIGCVLGSDRPTSVWQAVRSLVWEDRVQIASDVLDIHIDDRWEPSDLDEMIMEHILKVNTCTDLRSPVEVWVSSDGWTTVDVYDRP